MFGDKKYLDAAVGYVEVVWTEGSFERGMDCVMVLQEMPAPSCSRSDSPAGQRIGQ